MYKQAKASINQLIIFQIYRETIELTDKMKKLMTLF